MKFITENEAVNLVKKSIETTFTPEQIGHINDLLVEATNEFNLLKTSQHLCITKTVIPNGENVSLHYLANVLSSAGWKAIYKYDQRDGDWVDVDLPSIHH
jgi:hypothetical protein